MLGDLSKGRENNFDFLRFLFAALVCFTHSFVLAPNGSGYREWFNFLTLKQSSFGTISVLAFFIISGYLITASWERSKGFVDFMKKRILRIYPGFIVACLFCLFLAAPLIAVNRAQYFRDLNWRKLGVDLVFLNKIQPAHGVSATSTSDTEGQAPSSATTTSESATLDPVVQLDGSLWSIKIEFECYLLVALLGMTKILGRRNLVACLFGVFFAFYLLLQFPALMSHIPSHRVAELIAKLSAHITFGAGFLLGALIYLYREKIPVSRNLAIACAVVLGVSIPLRLFTVFLTPALAYLIIFFAFGKTLNLQKWGEKRDLSYGIYLYAWPAKLILIWLIGRSLNPYGLFLLALPASAGLAWLSWTFIEKPALSFKSGRAKG